MTSPPLSAMLCFNCPECRRASFSRQDIHYGYCGACHLCLADTSTSAKPDRYPPIWVIYDHPLDYPDAYVIRVAWGPWQEARVQLAGTLELARMAAAMEGASVCLGRFTEDDPKILECWI